MLLEGWLARAAAERPAHTAIEAPGGSWSYAELLAAAESGAAELRDRGVRSGEQVAIALAPGLAFACSAPSPCLSISVSPSVSER